MSKVATLTLHTPVLNVKDRMPLRYLTCDQKYPIFANIRPQAGSLVATQTKSARQGLGISLFRQARVCVAATLVVRRFDKIGMHSR